MNVKQFLRTVLLVFSVPALAACGPTKASVISETSAGLPLPHRVLVYNFAVSPDEVKLDRGISARIIELIKGTPRTLEEKKVGHAVANALAIHLTEELHSLGIPAIRAKGPLPEWGNTLEVDGQFISIDEGNRTERVFIGFGAGRTDVKAYVDVFYIQDGIRKNVAQFEMDAKSGYKPGVTETMGLGLVPGEVLSRALSIVSDAFTTSVEADARRMAKEIAKELKVLFVLKGWITPGANQPKKDGR